VRIDRTDEPHVTGRLSDRDGGGNVEFMKGPLHIVMLAAQVVRFAERFAKHGS
jgi:hypothetical protein